MLYPDLPFLEYQNYLGLRSFPCQLSILDSVGLIAVDAEPFFTVFLIGGVISNEKKRLAVAFEGQDVRGNAI